MLVGVRRTWGEDRVFFFGVWTSPQQPDRLRMGVVRPGMESDVRTGAELGHVL
ncbi:MAG TPA: hypothetical protein VJ398_08030 [Acidimicrobiia bacterium]|nr:hypothetical protein [Acidimicrobiia bacterium]